MQEASRLKWIAADERQTALRGTVVPAKKVDLRSRCLPLSWKRYEGTYEHFSFGPIPPFVGPDRCKECMPSSHRQGRPAIWSPLWKTVTFCRKSFGFCDSLLQACYRSTAAEPVRVTGVVPDKTLTSASLFPWGIRSLFRPAGGEDCGHPA